MSYGGGHNSEIAIPMEAVHALRIVQEGLGDTLVAVYLHGSAVAGGLQPNSDVDVLVIVNQPMTHAHRTSLVADLMVVSGHPADSKSARPLELIIFNQNDLADPHYPAHCEFIYGEWLRDAFEAGEIPQPSADPEFTVLLAQARQNTKTLHGPDPSEVLPAIPAKDVRRAIGDALSPLIISLKGDERNVLLTLARMWVTLATGKIVPKDVAAEWAISRLPEEPSVILTLARLAYLGLENVGWEDHGAGIRETIGELRQRISEMLDLNLTCAWRGSFENGEVNALHAECFEHDILGDDWWRQVNAFSLGWVCMRDGEKLVGFVNVAWDGGVHAFVLDTMVTKTAQRKGLATKLIEEAKIHTKQAGCEWLHVDFDPHLADFYLRACKFAPTAAGLISLR